MSFTFSIYNNVSVNPKDQVLAHNENYSNQKQVQENGTNAHNRYSMNDFTENKHNKSAYIIIKSHKIVTTKQNRTISNNKVQRFEEPASRGTGEYLKQETEKDLSYNTTQHSGNEDLLVQRYFKQYKLAANVNATISRPVAVRSFNNSKKLEETMTKEESSNKSQIHSKRRSMTSSTEESRQLSPGEFGYYFIGPKLWYVPLFFSIYFLCYVLALIIKSISRHKIVFVQKKEKVVKPYLPYGRSLVGAVLTESVLNALESATKKYL